MEWIARYAKSARRATRSAPRINSKLMTPLNGERTHPLTKYGWAALEELANGGPMPTQAINPGVINRLQRESLIDLYQAATPYPTRKGNIPWAKITQAGLDRLKMRGRIEGD